MSQENLCTATGCRGFCCEDIDLEVTESERRRLFPKAKPVVNIKELEKKKSVKGVFYMPGYETKELKGSGFELLSINGPCPNRDEEGKCLQHTERSYAARRFRIGCDNCNIIREEHGLNPVFFDPSE